MLRHALQLISAGLLAAGSTAAVAQSMPWINPAHTSVYSQDDVMSRHLDSDPQAAEQAESTIRFPSQSVLVAPATEAPSTAALDSTYRYSKARTKQNLDTFAARSPTAQARAGFEQMIAAQPTIIDDIRQGIAPYGLDSHDVADAYAMWWINSWLVYEKRDDDPDRGTVAMVKQQVRNAFAATPDFAKTNDAQRQEYAEALMIQALMLSAGMDQLKSQPKMLEQLSKAALQGAKASGLDLTLMTLTQNGFVPRKGADASEAGQDVLPESQEPAQRASVDDEGDNALALALAAGAGLGAVLLGGAAFMRRQG
ncbi:MAG: DUF6683 family protein [Pseudomonadota bacterium]|nr:DUF6683 family protein [Pseudomonadota bacterium]